MDQGEKYLLHVCNEFQESCLILKEYAVIQGLGLTCQKLFDGLRRGYAEFFTSSLKG